MIPLWRASSGARGRCEDSAGRRMWLPVSAQLLGVGPDFAVPELPVHSEERLTGGVAGTKNRGSAVNTVPVERQLGMSPQALLSPISSYLCPCMEVVPGSFSARFLDWPNRNVLSSGSHGLLRLSPMGAEMKQADISRGVTEVVFFFFFPFGIISLPSLY